MITLPQRKYINLILILGMVFMLLLGYLSYAQIAKLNNSTAWVIHSHQVIETADDLLIAINYTESSARGYFLSGDQKYLNHYMQGVDQVRLTFKKLNTLTSENFNRGEYGYLLKTLTKQIDERIIDINSKINIYNKFGADALHHVPRNGEMLGSRVRTTISQIILSENNLLRLQDQASVVHYIWIDRLILICSGFSLCFILLGTILFNQQINFRYNAENQLKKSEEELYKLAYYDPLTGLANRSLLTKTIDYLINTAEKKYSLALFFIDLDNFKNINDSLGHEIGDLLLQVISERLQKIVGEKNFVARLGGDEFIVVLRNIENTDEVSTIAKNISYSITDPIQITSHKLFVTSSIGISMYPANGHNFHTLLKHADIAMYRAKELGKNNYQFCIPEFTQYAEERARLDRELHLAVSNNEFFLVYQPIFSLQDGSIVSVEVLMRWNKPNVGVVFPEHFIKLAESNGLILPIGEWMLKTACKQAKTLLSGSPKPIKMALNISTKQFILSDFSLTILKILKETDFDPNLLELEVTESVLLDNTDINIATLNTLKEMGIKIAIDDFGTGYSALSYLRTFSIDKLKIDKSFIKEVTSYHYNASIVNAIITMAHDLNIAVIAEGIESEIQLDYFKRCNCDQGQGYYFSPPLTASEFAEYLRNYHNSHVSSDDFILKRD